MKKIYGLLKKMALWFMPVACIAVQESAPTLVWELFITFVFYIIFVSLFDYWFVEKTLKKELESVRTQTSKHS